MSSPFTASLPLVFLSADVLSINGYELEDDDCLPLTPGNVRVEIPDGEGTEFEFAPQDVTVDDEGQFTATTVDGETVNCVAHIVAPLTEQALLKTKEERWRWMKTPSAPCNEAKQS